MPADNASPNGANEATLNAIQNAVPGMTSDTAPEASPNAASNATTGEFPSAVPAEYPGAATAELPGAAPADYPGAATAELPGAAPAGFPGAIQGYRWPVVPNMEAPTVPNMEAPVPIDPEEQAAIRKLEERRAQARRKRITKFAIVGGVIVALMAFWFVSGIMKNNAESKNSHPEVAVVERGELSSSVQAR